MWICFYCFSCYFAFAKYSHPRWLSKHPHCVHICTRCAHRRNCQLSKTSCGVWMLHKISSAILFAFVVCFVSCVHGRAFGSIENLDKTRQPACIKTNGHRKFLIIIVFPFSFDSFFMNSNNCIDVRSQAWV